jgi:mRNA-degrading endonuclease RelE of RelBE toxin-antitoxin system
VKFHVEVTHQGEKDLRRVPTPRRLSLLRGFERLADDPTPDGDSIRAIVADPKGTLRRLRLGDYRVFFEVEGDAVFVLRCIHRQDLEKAIRQLLGR